ncbi:unnamed protein product [Paramecium octaurelia]|uniref:Uncharacterized protein n=1 Tax=Paramecium octaurelia TaxID=43137 RepID=A0A8S1XBY6_PAROT|nr:unnamed protein product [Paramecium octaurelia]
MNRRIQYISVLKVYSIKSQIQYFQSELEERRRNENYEQNIKEFGHFDYQIQKLICRLDLANLLEVRAYCNPPLIVLYIFEYLMILLNIKPKDPKDVFKSIKVMLSNPVELVCRLEQMKISDIKQSQLQKLTPILQIPVELAQNLARASGIICEIIQLIVKAHNSCQFTIQLFMIEEKITKNIYKLGHLNKIFGLNNN